MRALAGGSSMTADQCWQLAQRWYRGRLERDWRSPGPEGMAAIFEEVGLVGPFWSLE